MKSTIIPKEKAKELNIEVPFIQEVKSGSNFSDFSVMQGYPKTQQEKQQLDELLDKYFLYRNESIEREKKFIDFFSDEVKQERRTKPAHKFVDFIISKAISGTNSRKHSNIIELQDIREIKDYGQKTISENLSEKEQNPSFIYDESGKIVGLRLKCKCGEDIRVDFEFEND